MSEKKNPGNDKICQKVEGLGYCCVLAFMVEHTGKRWPHKRIAAILDIGYSTVEFNRRRYRMGFFKCEHAETCKGYTPPKGEE